MYAIRRTLAVFCLVIIFAAVPLVVKIMLGIPALFILLMDYEEFTFQSKIKSGGQQK